MDLRNVDHLRHRADFQAVMAAEVVSRTPHFVLHRRLASPTLTMPGTDAMDPPPDVLLGRSRVGAVLPKRLARRAVTRNALKRQIYNVMTAFESRLHFCHLNCLLFKQSPPRACFSFKDCFL